jgi:hypothetical protein
MMARASIETAKALQIIYAKLLEGTCPENCVVGSKGDMKDGGTK